MKPLFTVFEDPATVAVDFQKIQDVYGYREDNWGDLKIFQGGFINFGYWKNILLSKAPISLNQRILSSIQLYKQVAKHLNILPHDDVLEIGCGRGIGAITLFQNYPLKSFTGIDLTFAQIERCQHYKNKILHKHDNLNFQHQNAENTTFSPNAFTKIFAVESIHHMNSALKFAIEMRRILKKNGRLVCTTYLPTNDANFKHLSDLIPYINNGLGSVISVTTLENALRQAGFTYVYVHPIGQHVFEGYVRWSKQVIAENSWTYNYLLAYQQQLLDYYIIIAQ
ncbi:MAG: hypothetical protein A3F10_02070 [Coxiella sp. RIFCSPHIGHO2_12_FULL_42_15]|nr:MAG: hypothetical protein A3F10_02070 [Coxiella sp. RIFCSPHIGHO2_12_FULL_42_15]